VEEIMQQVCPQARNYDANVETKYRQQRKMHSEGKRKAAQAAQLQTLENRYRSALLLALPKAATDNALARQLTRATHVQTNKISAAKGGG
jgi:cell shape-determining protein MreC